MEAGDDIVARGMEASPRRALEEAKELDLSITQRLDREIVDGIQASQSDEAAARPDDAAPPPDDEASEEPAAGAWWSGFDEEYARSLPSMVSVFDAERGCGAMIVMAGGVIHQAATDHDSLLAREHAPPGERGAKFVEGAEAAIEVAAEYEVGEEVTQGGVALFSIEAVLGEGAFGKVYKARPTDGGAPLALKSVKPSLPAEKQFELQVQLAAETAICFIVGRHPHLVSVRRVLATPKGLLIAMDLIEGIDLRHLAGKDFKGTLYRGTRAEASKRIDALVAQLYKGLAHLHDRAVLHMDLKPANLMIGPGDHLRIIDYGLAGECQKRETDPWTGKTYKEKGKTVLLICAPFEGGTPSYMSEEVAGLRRELAAATTADEHNRIKEEKPVTAATTDIVAAALVTLELYARSNRWGLLMLTATEAAGVDGSKAREMARKLIDRKPADEMSSEELAKWLAEDEMLSRLQPMALEGGLTVGSILDAEFSGSMKALLPDATYGLRAKLRKVARAKFQTLAMPPLVGEAVEKSLDADVAKRPRNANLLMGGVYSRTKFGQWCDGEDKYTSGDVDVNAASQQVEEEMRNTFMPIARVLFEAGQYEHAGLALREWSGVSAAPAAREAFCECLEKSPAGLECALEFTVNTKNHWFREHRVDRATFERIVALAAEDHRMAAVTLVCIDDHQLGGVLPPELTRLTNLTTLNLRFSGLTGTIPTSIGGLTKLQRLELQRNALTGPLPATMPPSLEMLNLGEDSSNTNRFTGGVPTEWSSLTNLKELKMVKCALDGPLPKAMPPSLEVLTLGIVATNTNKFADGVPSEWGSLTNLKTLEMVGCGLDGNIPGSIGNLINLKKLWLQDNAFTGSCTKDDLKGLLPECGDIRV